MYELLFRKIKRKTLFLFIFTFYIVIISILLSSNSDCSGLTSIAISMIPLVPIIDYLIRVDEHIILKDSKKAYITFIKYYFSIFFAAIFAYYSGFLIYGENMFFWQIKAIDDIFNNIYEASIISRDILFAKILLNNLKLLVLIFLLSFVFGAGAIYVILWNASIVGVFLAIETKTPFQAFLKLLRLLPHGSLEFIAYFLSALSGNVLAVALLKESNKDIIEKIAVRSILMFVFSVIILVAAAFIESFF